MTWVRNKLKDIFTLYDIEDLQIGGHCGCCGKQIPDKIFEKIWSWGVCKECKESKGITKVPQKII